MTRLSHWFPRGGPRLSLDFKAACLRSVEVHVPGTFKGESSFAPYEQAGMRIVMRKLEDRKKTVSRWVQRRDERNQEDSWSDDDYEDWTGNDSDSD